MGGVGLAVIPPKDRGGLEVQVRFRIDRALNNRIDAVCRETGWERSDVLRFLVQAGLDLHESERRKK